MTPAGSQEQLQKGAPGTVIMPEPTAWPIVLAFGMALLFTGFITAVSVSILGGILIVVGCVGWFRDILPHEKHEVVRVVEEVTPITTASAGVARLEFAPELSRAVLPLEYFPISAGVKGGLAGGVAMAVLACLYGVIKQGSLWYPINLLAATVYAQSLEMGAGSLHSFHLSAFLLATLIHLVTCLLVGLVYGAMLPMFPRHPIFLGGVIAPLMWTGLLYHILGLINPLLDEKIDWKWFFASQVAFGIVAGIVVERQNRVRTVQRVPFAMRAGIEVPGAMQEKRQKDDRR
jgi:hypothetical protein